MDTMRWGVVVAAIGLGCVAAGRAALPAPETVRFFLAGDGTLALVSKHGGGVATVRYRDAQGRYDPKALARLRHAMRSADGKEGPLPWRLVELLSWVQRTTGQRPLTVLSGYRSPEHNEEIRANGARAASASLHTEGLAADLELPKKLLSPLWRRLRDRECCGAGLYLSQGFMHVDVGRPRFWEPATSKVEQNLSAGNARIFARTEFDRYTSTDEIVVSLYAVTVTPIGVTKGAQFLVDGGEGGSMSVVGAVGDCLSVPATGTSLHLRADGAMHGQGRIALATCDPRPEQTPATIETNPIELH